MKPTLFGNTTVRNPERLRPGAIALVTHGLEGNLQGADQAEALFRALLAARVVDGGSTTIGSKWRNAFCKMGLVYPRLRGDAPEIVEWNRLADQLTPLGQRLVEDHNALADVMLRVMARYQLPSPLDRDAAYAFPAFRPFGHLLRVMAVLENLTGDSRLSKDEMALFVQRSHGQDSPRDVAACILAFRAGLDAAAAPQEFVDEFYAQTVPEAGVSATTLRDYADTNMRYAAATGVCLLERGTLRFHPERGAAIQAVCDDTAVIDDDLAYVRALACGWALPGEEALEEGAARLRRIAEAKRREAAVPGWRREGEEALYAERQRREWPTIAAQLATLDARVRRGVLPDGSIYDIPRGDDPLHLENVVWRALLSLGGDLLSKVYETRGHLLDAAFRPVAISGPGQPDIKLSYPNHNLVAEVTLSEASRQEATEGESVRRHVVRFADKDGRAVPTYGLFIARALDLNTVDSFGRGVWYDGTERKDPRTVPLDLAGFLRLFVAMHETGHATPETLRRFLEECLTVRDGRDAPAWRAAIAAVLDGTIARLRREPTPDAGRGGLCVQPVPRPLAVADFVQAAGRGVRAGRGGRARRKAAEAGPQLAFDLPMP